MGFSSCRGLKWWCLGLSEKGFCEGPSRGGCKECCFVILWLSLYRGVSWDFVLWD